MLGHASSLNPHVFPSCLSGPISAAALFASVRTALTCGQNSQGTDLKHPPCCQLQLLRVYLMQRSELSTYVFPFPSVKIHPERHVARWGAWIVTLLAYFHLFGPLPISGFRPWDSYPGRDVHVNWSLMFTQHFPVGSDSLRLSSASSPFLTADTGRLTYPQEADVFSCWSHSILITWECSIARLIYLFSNATG